MGQQPSAPASGQGSPNIGSPAKAPGSPNPAAASPTSLDLSNRDFSEDKLAQFVKQNDLLRYSGLIQLTMSNCQLGNVDFVSTWATTLTDLDLSRNLIKTLDEPNEMIFFLKQLIKVCSTYAQDRPRLMPFVPPKLNLSYNYIQVMPMMFFNLISLQTLNLSNNNITAVCKELKYLDHLTDLDLSCNQVATSS